MRPALSLYEAVISGCDERVFLDPATGKNRYFLDPFQSEGLFQRGSCTCGSLTPDGLRSAQLFLELYPNQKYSSILKEQADRLRYFFSSSTEFEVFFGPSGSDMMYFPLFFSLLLHPHKPIVNIVSCPEELGAGSRLAAELKFHSEYTQFGDKIKKGALLAPHLTPHVEYLNARNEDGQINLKRRDFINAIVCQNHHSSIIGNLVFGSKSGIKDDLRIIDEMREDVMWVVDMCQFRSDENLIPNLLQKDAMVMVTGSKFFQAPPFCGALLVPRSWTDRLRRVKNTSAALIFRKLFSAYDIPSSLPELRNNLEFRENAGLRLRWNIALDEMEAYVRWDPNETTEFIRQWNVAISDRLKKSRLFELMPNQALTNDSIISFMVKINDVTLDNEQLKLLFKTLVTSKYTLDGFTNVFIGQPVQYLDYSFIRLAIGSYTVRKQLESGARDFNNDMLLIRLIEETALALFS